MERRDLRLRVLPRSVEPPGQGRRGWRRPGLVQIQRPEDEGLRSEIRESSRTMIVRLKKRYDYSSVFIPDSGAIVSA